MFFDIRLVVKLYDMGWMNEETKYKKLVYGCISSVSVETEIADNILIYVVK